MSWKIYRGYGVILEGVIVFYVSLGDRSQLLGFDLLSYFVGLWSCFFYYSQ